MRGATSRVTRPRAPECDHTRVYGDPNAPVALVFEPGAVIGREGEQNLMRAALKEAGFSSADCYMVYAYPTMPKAIKGSEREEAAFIMEHRPELLERLGKSTAKIAVAFGKGATRAVSGKAVKITKVRGQAWEYPDVAMPVMPCYSPANTLFRPELTDIFYTDLQLLRRMKSSGWDFTAMMRAQSRRDYKWCTDLEEVLDLQPDLLAVDTETTGLDWYRPDTRVITVQLAHEEGAALVVPINLTYWPELGRRGRGKLLSQLKQLLENPRIDKVAHNLSYDHHMLGREGITVKGWWRDTQVMAFAADDNMQDKSLDECVRRWVPPMAGYNDEHNRTIDKSRMIELDRDTMLSYAGGDADALLRLTLTLDEICAQDGRTDKLLDLVQMPALRVFSNVMEDFGVPIDEQELSNLSDALDVEYDEIFSDLMDMVPRKVKAKHAEKGLKFTRPDFVRDILFSKDGLGLKPVVFTPSTMNKENPADRIPSTDAKNHLMFFDDEPFVRRYQEFSKISKMRSTYVGKEHSDDADGPTGFWQYLHEGTIHPTFNLHVTKTGRTSSRNPNGQNIPKRGRLAEAYRKVFRARPGFTLIECDLSQAELRIAAWMAWENTMLDIYANGGDIHASTAAASMRLTTEQFMALDKDTRDLQRFRAKAVNFGFLYGMGWRKFRAYAKTDYQLDYTEEEAQETREVFFQRYPGLAGWHKDMEAFVREHGYVRALHGALRRLPAVFSSEDSMQHAAIRQAINSPVQRFASDLGLIALSRIARDVDLEVLRPIMFIHDALVFECADEHVESMSSAIKFYMETPPLEAMFGIKPPIPIVADVSIGKNLSKRKNDPAKDNTNPEGMYELKGVQAIAPDWYNARADRDLIFYG